MTVYEAISLIDNIIPDKKSGLPEDLYYFISRVTPLVCVDLLIRDMQGRILLSWRDDEYYGNGWHIPGGIVRFKETFEQRIQRTAEREIGVIVNFDPKPIWIENLIDPEQDNLGHIIAFVYRCYVPDSFIPDNSNRKHGDVGYLEWHKTITDNLLKIQNYFKGFINCV
jgi:colanic acid biosynthesis protein WcaH